MQPTRHVLLLVSTYACYGRRIIDGILDYRDRVEPGWEFDYRHVRRGMPKTIPSHVDGVIAEIRTSEESRRVASWNVPVVTVAGGNPNPCFSSVSADNMATGALAATYFLGRGLEHFAFFGATHHACHRERLAGFKQSLADHRPSAPLAVHDLSPIPRREDQIRLLRDLPSPCGVFAAVDAITVELANLCRDGNIPVPDHCALLGVDDDHRLCRMSTPRLSSIDHGTHRMGFEAAELLQRHLFDPDLPPQHHRVPPLRVVERQSTDVLAVNHPGIRKAVRFMRSRVANPPAVPDIAREAGMSRRALETGFRHEMDCTVHTYMMRARVDKVRELLTHTALPLSDISEKAGFSGGARMASVFKKHQGCTPSQYRKRNGWKV